jgi:hypothetical protein
MIDLKKQNRKDMILKTIPRDKISESKFGLFICVGTEMMLFYINSIKSKKARLKYML